LDLNNDKYANIIEPKAGNYDVAYTIAGTTDKFVRENCVVRADIVRIDSELQNKFDERLNTGGKITFKYSTYYSQILKVLGATCSVNLSRSLTFFNTCFRIIY